MRCSPTAQRAHEDAATRGNRNCSAAAGARADARCRQIEPWLPAERLQKEFDAIGFFLTGHPLDDYAATLKRMRVQSWAEFARAVRAGASAGRVAGTVVARTERRTRTGSKMGIIGLSDPTGHYEAVLFSEGLAQFRDLLEPGAAVLLMLSAELQGDDVRARIQMVEPLDQAAAKLSKGLRVFLRGEAPIESVAKRLEGPEAAATPSRQGRRRGRAGADARRRHRGRGEAPRPLQGLAADRRRHQGGAGRGGGRGGVIRSQSALIFRETVRGKDSADLGRITMKIMIAWLGAAVMALVAAAAAAETAMPQFQVDPFWPKPLPNNWILGQVSGIATDKYDRIWVVHRPGSLTPRERAAEQNPPEAKCCVAAPPVLRVRPVRQSGPHLGRSRSRATNGPRASTAFSSTTTISSGSPATARRTANCSSSPWTASSSCRSASRARATTAIRPTRLGSPADVAVDVAAKEVFAADGYGNRRVVVFDSETGAYKRHWGAYGNNAERREDARYDPAKPPSQQFGNPVHCIRIDKDGLVYVCDRTNNRLQIFRKDGTFVAEHVYEKATRGTGSVYDLVFSPDKEQKFIYMIDGMNGEVRIVDRASKETLGRFGRPGRQVGQFTALHNIAVDRQGNIFTSEVQYRPARAEISRGLQSEIAAISAAAISKWLSKGSGAGGHASAKSLCAGRFWEVLRLLGDCFARAAWFGGRVVRHLTARSR